MLTLRLTARRAGVVLMYHSVEHRAGDSAQELVPPHETSLFEHQVLHLKRHYRVVPAAGLLDAVRERRRGQRFPAAITFDDDLACHATVSMPILSRIGLTATYFLSGASLEHPFAFWYERLQRAHDEDLPDLAELVVGREEAVRVNDIHALSLRMEHMSPAERDGVASRLEAVLGVDPPDAGIRAEQVRSLTDAGMTVGFHTRRHDSLSFLDDQELSAALVDGRDELAASAGAPLDVIGYPHGRADERVGGAARVAGFRAGFTTQPVAVTPATDPLLQGRIAPSLRSVGALSVQLALTLMRLGSGRPTAAPARRAS